MGAPEVVFGIGVAAYLWYQYYYLTHPEDPTPPIAPKVIPVIQNSIQPAACHVRKSPEQPFPELDLPEPVETFHVVPMYR
jgi:hypothetical protein